LAVGYLVKTRLARYPGSVAQRSAFARFGAC
jgi:hypothetical protein